ncbi:hypothetical protein CAMRE0001_2725 [Campylobacter rectus RM3267]|uniref:Uncharacterized protein n=1 Tax=Campylobacter rectus RM3267 TaxID=553218 RepID=B9D0S9_CAMRE|nr:hypothetical protein CAMRE0001_2725 [Campylobacter rectus RM3267]
MHFISFIKFDTIKAPVWEHLAARWYLGGLVSSHSIFFTNLVNLCCNYILFS